MKKPKIKVIAVDKKDKKNAKILAKVLDYQWKRYEGIITAITTTRMAIESIYAIKTPDRGWNKILEEVIQLDIKDNQ